MEKMTDHDDLMATVPRLMALLRESSSTANLPIPLESLISFFLVHVRSSPCHVSPNIIEDLGEAEDHDLEDLKKQLEDDDLIRGTITAEHQGSEGAILPVHVKTELCSHLPTPV
ncbi:hypothetical protein YC2023_094410 [Brassica napus]